MFTPFYNHQWHQRLYHFFCSTKKELKVLIPTDFKSCRYSNLHISKTIQLSWLVLRLTPVIVPGKHDLQKWMRQATNIVLLCSKKNWKIIEIIRVLRKDGLHKDFYTIDGSIFLQKALYCVPFWAVSSILVTDSWHMDWSFWEHSDGNTLDTGKSILWNKK